MQRSCSRGALHLLSWVLAETLSFEEVCPKICCGPWDGETIRFKREWVGIHRDNGQARARYTWDVTKG